MGLMKDLQMDHTGIMGVPEEDREGTRKAIQRHSI